MTAVLCIAHCRLRGRHLPDCAGADLPDDHAEHCRGCLPRAADDGSRLCSMHVALIATHATRCGELHDALAEVLAAPERPGERTSGTRTRGTVINERAAEMRTELRSVLVSWCKLVAEERGITLPPDNVRAMGDWLAAHHVWLAATEYAAECSAELDDLARRAHWVAHPSGTRAFDVGPCPAARCEGTIRAVLRPSDLLLPSALVCDVEPEHEWTADRWRELGHAYGGTGRWMTAQEIAARYDLSLGRVYGLASEHQWARTTDRVRPRLYRTADVEAAISDVEVGT